MSKEIFIELTDKCNLKCNYCNKYSWNNFIKLELFEKIISQISSSNKIDFLCLWWWEPMLHPNFFDILKIIENNFLNYKWNFKLSINTNWTLLWKNILFIESLIKKLKNINFFIYISLDWYGTIWNLNRNITDKQFIKIQDNINLCKKLKLYKNFNFWISSVLTTDFIRIKDFKYFLDFYYAKNININFCFQEKTKWTKLFFSRDLVPNILSRYILLRKKWYKIIIESNKDLNNVIRIDSYWNVYNFIDETFYWSENFLLSKKWDLSFLLRNNLWEQKVSNQDIWNIIYQDNLYIKFISKIFYTYEQNRNI